MEALPHENHWACGHRARGGDSSCAPSVTRCPCSGSALPPPMPFRQNRRSLRPSSRRNAPPSVGVDRAPCCAHTPNG